jgi:D-psicose/D-tagatose/L-ribulose 3-epimerase
MRIGVHLSLWQREWEEDVSPLIDRAASLGFDGVEVSLYTLRAMHAPLLRRRVEAAGLGITCSTGLLADTDIGSEDAEVRAAGLKRLQQDVQLASEVGATILCGVLYSAWGRTAFDTSRDSVLARSLDVLWRVAETAHRAGLTLGIEAINRYESSLVNTAAQARALVDALGSPTVGVHLDTYHMNIEEPDVDRAVETAGARLVHVHCAGVDRGPPGPGRFPWSDLMIALGRVRYDGWLTLECGAHAGTAVANSYNLWRPLGDPDTVAAAGLEFLKRLLATI